MTSSETRSPIDVLREKADLFVITGFRDDDGVWHDGPHRIEFDIALTNIERLVDAVCQSIDIGDEINRCRVCWKTWGKHADDCALRPFVSC